MTKPYLLYVGNLYPHKNIPVLIKAAQKVNIDLNVVCARTIFADRLPMSKYVHFLGHLSDDQLKKQYQGAFAFVTPSLIEGFGLPGLEAMASGCPVIAARASCLPEIYGDAALFFDPYDVNDLVAKVKLLQSDPKLRPALISQGKIQAKKYSWRKMAQQTWQIYQKILR